MKILVTGGSRGIGKAIAKEAAQAGHELLVVSKNVENLEKGYNDVKSVAKSTVEKYVCDVSDRAQLEKLYAYCKHIAFLPDVLVLSAGIFMDDVLLMTPSDEPLDATLNVNFLSIHYMVKLFIDHLRTVKSSKIIIIGSTSAYGPYPTGAISGVAKWALRGYAINLRRELMKDYIGVTFVAPGGTLTDMWEGYVFPENHLLDPGDIAKLIVAILSLSNQAVVEELIIRPMLGDISD